MTSKLNENWGFIEEVLESIKKASKAQSTVGDFINPDCDFLQSAYKVESYLVEALALLVDDKAGWLEWFVYENAFGKKALKAGLKEDLRPIKTLTDLRALIDGGK